MEDIGMHPDYRSGNDRPEVCHICGREEEGDRLIYACYECGKPTCRDCIERALSGWFCDSCVEQNW